MNRIFLPILVLSTSVLISFFYWRNFTPQEITFSDGAHHAIVARELVNTGKWRDLYSFWGGALYKYDKLGHFNTSLLPLTPLSITASFLLLGISDLSAIIPGIIFTSLSSLLIFLIAKKHLTSTSSLLCSLIFVLFQPILDYTTSAASEPLFTLMILLSIFLVENKRTLLGLIVVSVSIFSRQHGVFYLFSLITSLIFLLPRQNRNRALAIFFTTTPLFIVAAYVLSLRTSLPFLSYLPFRDLQVLLASSSISPDNQVLRSNQEYRSLLMIIKDFTRPLLSKVIYNAYNLLKMLPQTFPPYLIPFTTIALFSKKHRFLSLFLFFSFIINLFVISASVPSLRYFHPLFPLVIILAIIQFKEIKLNFPSTILIFSLFIFIPASSLLLDQRYFKSTHNPSKPSAVKQLSLTLKEKTPTDALIVTNLDSWGSWFGQRQTILFPVSPSDLESQVEFLGKNQVTHIYLVSYKADVPSNYVGTGWRDLLSDPPLLSDPFLNQNYKLVDVFEFPAESNFDNLKLTAVLLERL